MPRIATPFPVPEREPSTTDVQWRCPWCSAGSVSTVPDDEVHAAIGIAWQAFALHVGAHHPEHKSEIG